MASTSSVSNLPMFPPIFENNGKFRGSDHFKEVYYSYAAPTPSELDKRMDYESGGHLDISDIHEVCLDKLEGDPGKTYLKEYYAPIYYFKPASQSFMISLACLVLPVMIGYTILPMLPPIPQWLTISLIAVSCLGYLGLSWAYNIIRIPFVTVYLVLRTIFYDSWKKGLWTAVKENGSELVKQLWLSIVNIIRAPYYAFLYNLGHLYALVSPLNGRKFVTKVELAWNHNIPLRESFSLAGCCESGFRFGMYNAGSLTRCYHLKGFAVFRQQPELSMTDKQLQAILLRVTSPGKNANFTHCAIKSETRLIQALPSGCWPVTK